MTSVEEKRIGYRLSPLEGDLILCLREEPKVLAELRERIDAVGTSILHAIRTLEDEKLVSRDPTNHSYSLTSIGHAQAILFDQLIGTSDTLRSMEEFWLRHDISCIPDYLLSGIRNLKDAVVVRSSPSDLHAVHHKYLDVLKNSKRIHGASAIFHPDFATCVAEILGSGAEVKLVVTKEVLDSIKKEVKLRDLAKYATRILINRNLELTVHDGLRIGLTVTESRLSFGLFTLDGVYDYNVDVMSTHPSALEWGERLFEHYRANGKRIKLSSLL